MNKKILLLMAVSAIFVGCASKKAATPQPVSKNDVEVLIPCTGADFQSTKDVFRATGNGFSADMSIARSKALQNARAELATSISTTMKRVVDNYASSYQTNSSEEAKSKFQDLSRSVVNQQLNGSITICEKTMRTPENQFRVYVAVELGGPKVLDAMNKQVSDDQKLRVDYEYEKFKKTFEEEMSKLNK